MILKTTLGDIDIELWAKEAPKVGHCYMHNCRDQMEFILVSCRK